MENFPRMRSFAPQTFLSKALSRSALLGLCTASLGLSGPRTLLGAPVVADLASTTPGPGLGAGDGIAAAPLAGIAAHIDSSNSRLTIANIRGQALRVIELSAFTAVLAQANVPLANPAISSVTTSSTGRLIIVTLRDSANTGARLDPIVRIDTDLAIGSASPTAGLSFLGGASAGGNAPVPMAHARGRLFVGTPTGQVIAYRLERNDTALTALTTHTLPTLPQVPQQVSALAFDRTTNDLYASNTVQLFRIPNAGAVGVTVTNVLGSPTTSNIVGLAFADHFGSQNTISTGGGPGLYIAHASGQLRFLTLSQARSVAADSVLYTNLVTTLGTVQSLAPTADGSVWLSGTTASVKVTDSLDSRISFDMWPADEVRQVVDFSRTLESPDGQGSGWVIDANTLPGSPRFHPASPDAAAWTVLLAIADHNLATRSGDLARATLARDRVLRILRRHAGQAADNIRPSRNADGIFEHWIEPTTGLQKPGWGDGFATLSTMKIVLASARAKEYFSGDAQIVDLAKSIVCSVRNVDSYLQSSTGRLFYLGNQAGGGRTGTLSSPFNEGILFVEQAARYGSPTSGNIFNLLWMTRSALPSATFVTGRPVSGDVPGAFQSAFVSLYSALLQSSFRADPTWNAHVENLRASHAAWTDDNPVRWYTVFSAGTTKGIWSGGGGYFADAITNQQGNVSTFTSLLALAGRPGVGLERRSVELAAGYQAYRTGARQAWNPSASGPGGSILYRRSSIDPAYLPNSAGLPDVALGALGLLDFVAPAADGLGQSLLTSFYPSCAACPADIASQGGVLREDGRLDNNDFAGFIDAFFRGAKTLADIGAQGGTIGGDGQLDNNDFAAFIGLFFGTCP